MSMIIHDLPREVVYSAAMRKMEKKLAAAEAENVRLQGFVMKLADRLAGASEVLGKLAERKDRRRLYSIGTYDGDAQAYTPQAGLSRSPINCTWRDLLQICRELCHMGYSCHYRRDANGNHDDNDPSVLIERTDGESEASIMERWKR